MKFSMEESVTRAEALELMKKYWEFTPGREMVSLNEALGRVTAEAVYSRNTLPVFRASCFDGVAVRSEDFKDGIPDVMAWVKGRDFVRADTGDDFPDEFDAVIAMEDVILEGDKLRFQEGFCFDPDEKNVDPAGTIVKEGALLVPAHTRITPELTAGLAMGGIKRLPVLKRLHMTFIPTGSELVAPGVTPQRGQNVETNGIMLKNLLMRWGVDLTCRPIVKDEAAALEHALDEALRESDFVLINGGSSRGEEDFNSHMLKRRGSFFRHGVKAVPGRPIAFSIIEGKPVLNIPGPVAAAYLAEHWCLCALACHWYGLPDPQYPTVTAKLSEAVRKRPGFELISRVALRRTADGYQAIPINWGEDGIPGLLLNTDGFLNVPADIPGYSAGDMVEVELLKSPELIAEGSEIL